jgi:hypothetical protein
VPGIPSAPPNPVSADGLPGVKVVYVGGSDVDLTVHNSAPPLTHQVGAGGGFGGAFTGRSAAPAAPNALRLNHTTQATADFFKGASQGRPSKRDRYHFSVFDLQYFGNISRKSLLSRSVWQPRQTISPRAAAAASRIADMLAL